MKSKRKKALESKIGAFERQYARKAQKGVEPNDRRYDRKFEQKIKRMPPEELNDLLYGENEELLKIPKTTKHEIFDILNNISQLLSKYGDASVDLKRFKTNEKALWAFLTSNELWGGAGSIADQAILANSGDRALLESFLIRLGEIQLSLGKVNIRTAMWVEAFKALK